MEFMVIDEYNLAAFINLCQQGVNHRTFVVIRNFVEQEEAGNQFLG